MIDVEEKEEKELLILLNNPSAQGEWDYDTLRELIPDIDYKDAGLTEQDLDIIGVDFHSRQKKKTPSLMNSTHSWNPSGRKDKQK